MTVPYAVLATVPLFFDTDTPNYQSVISTISSTLSDSNITSVLGYAAGLAVVMVFTWWAVRKVTGIVKSAFMRGKLRF